MPGKVQKLAPPFENLIRSALGEVEPAHLARDVRRLSDFYLAHPGRATPWSEDYAVPATLAYFMPLNYARLASVFREVERFIPDGFSEVWDFGSGLGTTQWVLEDSGLTPGRLNCIEVGREAVSEHKRLIELRAGRWRTTFDSSRPSPGAMAVFSYSFLEMPPPDLSAFEHVLILEPSTRECGRSLMEWRAKFIDAGFTMLAPCTHHEACPLLVNSSRDWCHQRVAFEAPDWWLEIENHLPMKNRTLTYSYLLFSRSASRGAWDGAIRVIGDTLEERGKTRQLICRGPQREFFSWLHKEGDPPSIPHGALIKPIDAPVKSSEVRVPRDLRWE